MSRDAPTLFRDTPNALHLDSLDSEPNLQDFHVDPHDPTDLKCRKLLEINQNIKYALGIMDTQLEFFKRKQIEKSSENKKLKDKLKAKYEKEAEIKKHNKLQRDRIKKQVKGYFHIQQEMEELTKDQEAARQLRLNAQQKKNEIYQKYQEAEEEYKKLIYDLKKLEGINEGLEAMEHENQELIYKLEEVDDFLNERGEIHEYQKDRKATIQKVKEMNEAIRELDQEQAKLITYINNFQKEEKDKERQRMLAEEKTSKISKMDEKINQISLNIASKRTEFTHLDSVYKQLCIEENKLKKEYIIERECLEEQRKYRNNKIRSYPQNQRQREREKTFYKKEVEPNLGKTYSNTFQNIFSENDQRKESNSSSKPEEEDSNLELSRIQLMNIIKRYENIKNK